MLPVYQVSATVLMAIKEWAGQLGVIAFTVGALMYYSVLYRSKLIPRWISGWGILAAASSLAAALLTIIWPGGSFFHGFRAPAASHRPCRKWFLRYG